MSRFSDDLKYAVRTLSRKRGFSVVVVLTLGLGIGANTAFFSILNAVLIRPMGYPEADRLIVVNKALPERGVDRALFSPPDVLDLQRDQRSFEAAAFRNVPLEVSGGPAPELIDGAKVSADLFRVLRVDPLVGRTFSSSEDRPGERVVVLSWGLWQRRHQGNPSVVGQIIQLDRQPYTVIGVMPATFEFPRRGLPFNSQPADAWVPLGFTDRELAERGSANTNSVIARLKPGVSMAAAQRELDVIAGRIYDSYPPVLRTGAFRLRLVAQLLREEVSGRFATPLLMLLGAVGLVLLVACANVANLFINRTVARAHEIGVRLALGAERRQLLQLLLCEALLLSSLGGMSGLLFAFWTLDAVPSVLGRTIPGLESVQLDVRVLGFAAALCVATAIAFTVIPLAAIGRRGSNGTLGGRPTGATPALWRRRVQSGLVVTTVGLSVVLLIGAGLLLRSLAARLSSEVGFRPDRVLTTSMTLPRTFYQTGASVRAFYRALYARISELPDVRSAAIATDLPLSTYESRVFTPERADLGVGDLPTTNLTWVHGPYFQTLGIALRGGRFFSDDEYLENRRVIIVNERLAALFWPGENAVGKRLKLGVAASPAPWLTIVGVIGDVTDGPIGAEPGIHAYEPFRQFPDFFLDGATNNFGRDVTVALRTNGDPRALMTSLRREISGLDRDLALQRVALMDDLVNDLVAPQRFGTILVTSFAGGALLLASIGLFGLLGAGVAQRKREIAVRQALGATPREVLAMVMAQGARLVTLGLAAGLATSFAFARLLAALLYRTDTHDIVTFSVVPVVVMSVALGASLLPAWQASRVEPLGALKAD